MGGREIRDDKWDPVLIERGSWEEVDWLAGANRSFHVIYPSWPPDAGSPRRKFGKDIRIFLSPVADMLEYL
jgi:hypothetical protein